MPKINEENNNQKDKSGLVAAIILIVFALIVGIAFPFLLKLSIFDSRKVTWVNDDGTVLEVDERVSRGVTPTYDGTTPSKTNTGSYTYTFKGWSPEIKPIEDKDVIYVATYEIAIDKESVIIDLNGHGSSETKEVKYGEKIQRPEDPVAEGYIFDGWFKDEECTKAWDFDNDVATENTTLYAKWIINQYTVSFNSKGGSAVANIKVDYNSKVTAPTAPTKEGCSFEGWYKDEGIEYKWNFSEDKVTSNITLYAKWTVNQFVVAFDMNDHGYPVATQIVDYNGLVNEPVTPSQVGYTFDGWYKEQTYENAWNFSTDKITSDTTIYAKWTAHVFKVVFDVNNEHCGQSVDAQDVAYGDYVTNPGELDDIELDPMWGFSFAYWYADDPGVPWNFSTDTVTGDTVLHARWSEWK